MVLFRALAIKFIKGHWGSLLPGVFKAAAEGEFGPQIRAVYWWLAGKKTISGAIFVGVGTALEAVCANYPDLAWSCGVSRWIWEVGAVLAAVGLVDGGTRAPWPTSLEDQQRQAAGLPAKRPVLNE